MMMYHDMTLELETLELAHIKNDVDSDRTIILRSLRLTFKHSSHIST